MSSNHLIGRTVGVAAIVGLTFGTAVGAQAPEPPVLVGRAVLPVETYLTGAGNPSAGNFFAGQTINGITFPLPGQPVEGFSAIVEGRRKGEWLAMPDNGFGNKANSGDFLIRAYYLQPDFKTAGGGTGDVVVGDHIQFSDPNGLIGFPVVRPDRRLTGGDIDPESLQVSPQGDMWVGDEFGPWILHFDSAGRLLEAPVPLPGDLKSPSNPFVGAPANATVAGSRGIEGMGISGKHLYPVLEGATVADLAAEGTGSRRRLMFEYDTHRGEFTGRQWVYRTESSSLFVSDVAPLDPHRLVVMERDGGRGLAAANRKVYVVDLREVDGDGFLVKREVLDLAAIRDPNLVSLPEIHAGDVGIGDPFRVTCESVEAIRVVDKDQVLVGCDNNIPNTGRNPALADDNEFIVVDVPTLSDR